MQLHDSTFKYLQPTAQQIEDMAKMRANFDTLAMSVQALVPGGPDQTYILRKIRECAMWANVAITRQPDGTPRT